MYANRAEYDRDTFAAGAVERKTSPSPPPGGKEFPFPPFPAANSSTLNEAFSGSIKNRDGEHKRRARSHSRSASSLLLVATERLGQETNRANALDLRCGEVLEHLRTIVEDRDQLRRSLAKVTEELSLYKLQLDVAQNEIFRAQKIVDGVDKARVEAEEQAAKDRTLARQLVSERAVWVAREEGRNEGFQEGLRQGRRLAFDPTRRRRGDEYTDDAYEEAEEDPETYEPSVRHSPPSNRRGWSSPSRSAHSTLPDAASYASTSPVRAVSPPASPNAPATQPHPPATPRPPTAQYPERPPSARPSRPLPRAPARSPEPIDIRPDRSNFRARTPSVSHRAMTPPPDGFIPTVGADSVITLPPPHELSRPVSFVEEGTLRTPTGRGRTMSNVSRVSTRMSQYDILSPPQRSETPFTRSDQVAQAWRAANSPVDPPERERRQAATQDGHGSENFSTRSSLPRSQVSRRSGPRRPREIVMPMPLSTSMHAAGMSHARPATAQPEPQQQPYTAPAGPSYAAAPAPPAAGSYAPTTTSYFPAEQSYFEDSTRARARSAIGTWIKTRFNRSFSASSVPNIQIEPPSNPASNSSTGNTMNAVLLTPDDAGHHTLPQHFVPELARALEGVQHADTGAGSVIVLPDGQLPRGFVPLSPILPDLHGVDIDTAPRPFPAPANAAPAPSPQPPAYSPRDIYAPPVRPATATGTRSRAPPPRRPAVAAGVAGRAARASAPPCSRRPPRRSIARCPSSRIRDLAAIILYASCPRTYTHACAFFVIRTQRLRVTVPFSHMYTPTPTHTPLTSSIQRHAIHLPPPSLQLHCIFIPSPSSYKATTPSL